MAPPPLPADYDQGAPVGPSAMGWSSSVAGQALNNMNATPAAAAAAQPAAKGWGDDQWGFPEPPSLAEINQPSTHQQHDWVGDHGGDSGVSGAGIIDDFLSPSAGAAASSVHAAPSSTSAKSNAAITNQVWVTFPLSYLPPFLPTPGPP